MRSINNYGNKQPISNRSQNKNGKEQKRKSRNQNKSRNKKEKTTSNKDNKRDDVKNGNDSATRARIKTSATKRQRFQHGREHNEKEKRGATYNTQ